MTALRRRLAPVLLLACAAFGFHAPCGNAAIELMETGMLAADVAAGKLPPVARRVPHSPMVTSFDGTGFTPGVHGGTLHMLIGRAQDVRMLFVYGYARLVHYDRNFALVPDILESVDVEDNRVFTMRLRKGHRWSDGHPFTAEDFRYYWEDVANHLELNPTGPPSELLVDGKLPEFKVLDSTTVRYAWSSPNPDFLVRMAGASPLLIYRPAHYLKKYHASYTKQAEPQKGGGGSRRPWSSVHNKLDNMYRFDNPDLPTLQPWMNITRPPADRFVAVRNPYFHRIDDAGRQLPYIDRVEMVIANDKLIAAKSGTGEADLQARGIQFGDYTFLKTAEQRNKFRTLLWRSGVGSQLALYPNLNVNDPVWRKLLRDVRFRRALSLAIDRALINNVLYFGLAVESNNTVMAESPLFQRAYQTQWAKYDRGAARRLLDELGLKRGLDGLRRLPDGRPLEIIVETAGESTEDTDMLELIRETWREVGIKLLTKPSQREVFRNRIFAGETLMSIFKGLENGIATPDMSPEELAPTSQQQLQWPKFGQFYESTGKSGVAPDMPEIADLLKLYEDWRAAGTNEQRAEIWQRMLQVHADQQYVIGTVNGVPQPVVVRNSLMNVPEEGLYCWSPGAYFGVYRLDTFWFK
ncbi:MAG: ABC transporter substrate-binding protein [Betaproteobacteria bacterium]|nr:ABC transporter substrate-binding protein [Betaproteobacteria bacterium]